MGEVSKNGTKISIIGAGNVGATIAYTFAVAGTCSEIVLIDINKDKATGEAMDIRQGVSFCYPVKIYSGDYADAAGSEIVVVTLGKARKPGQTRLDLAQSNVDLIKEIMPGVAEAAPNAVYVVVSNPVDIITYAILQCTDLSPRQVIGSGTVLDSSRLRSLLADHVHLSSKSVHAYVFGEHGDTAMIPWSLTNIAGMEMDEYCTDFCARHNACGKTEIASILTDVRTAGAEVIKRKGATFYAIALSVNKICDVILRDAHSILTVSVLTNGRYGIDDVCLSLPYVVGGRGIERAITPPLLPGEIEQLHASANALKAVLKDINF